MIEKLGQILKSAGMVDVVALPKARVPVCKFTYPATRTRIDVTINNMLACVNTRLLNAYANIDPRLRQIVFLVKHWAKQRGVNDAYRCADVGNI